MPAAPIGPEWAAGSWEDTAWEEFTWTPFIPPPGDDDGPADAGLGQIKVFSDAGELGGGGW